MPKDAYERSTWRRNWFRGEVFAMWGTDCWLCGREGADTADHVIPRKTIRDLGLDSALLFDPENGRPAHKRCNSRRGVKPVGVVRPVLRDEVASGW